MMAEPSGSNACTCPINVGFVGVVSKKTSDIWRLRKRGALSFVFSMCRTTLAVVCFVCSVYEAGKSVATRSISYVCESVASNDIFLYSAQPN